jgi:hypothetical protein
MRLREVKPVARGQSVEWKGRAWRNQRTYPRPSSRRGPWPQEKKKLLEEQSGGNQACFWILKSFRKGAIVSRKAGEQAGLPRERLEDHAGERFMPDYCDCEGSGTTRFKLTLVKLPSSEATIRHPRG